jgi:hypothetical protein
MARLGLNLVKIDAGMAQRALFAALKSSCPELAKALERFVESTRNQELSRLLQEWEAPFDQEE